MARTDTNPPEMLTPAEVDAELASKGYHWQTARRAFAEGARWAERALLAKLREQQPVGDLAAGWIAGRAETYAEVYSGNTLAEAYQAGAEFALRSTILQAATPVPTPAAQAAQAVPADTQLLDFLAAESLDLRCFTVSDDDVGWRTVQHHQGKPVERVASEVYRDDPRQAIREAMQRLQRDPYCTGPLHQDEAAPTPTGAGDEGGAR